MWRSRCVVTLSVLSLLALALAAPAVAGGPPAPAAGPSYMPMPMGGPAMGGKRAGLFGDLTITGGVGSGEVAGADGASPRSSFEKIGCKYGTTYNFRAVTDVKFKGVNARIAADYFGGTWSGEGQHQFGTAALVNPTTGWVYSQPGDRLDAEFNMNWYGLSADIASGSAGSVGGYFDVGPRLVVGLYQDAFTLKNLSRRQDSWGSNGAVLGGLGLYFNFDFLRMLGLAEHGFFRGYHHGTVIKPSLYLAASIGGSPYMRYMGGEIFLRVFETNNEIFKNKYVKFAPSLKAEIGYVGWEFKETTDDYGGVPNTIKDADYGVGSYLARFNFNF